MAYKNNLLWFNQGHNSCIGPSRGDPQCCCFSLRSFRKNCLRLKLAIYIKVLVLIMVFSIDKKKLSLSFHIKKNGQTKKENNTLKVYLGGFGNWQPNDQAKLLLISKFVYNNFRNNSIRHIPFQFHCGFHPWLSFKPDVDSRSWSRSANEPADKLK